MSRLHLRFVFIASLCAAQAQAASIGINVLLNTEATDEILADLDIYGQVLDVFPEINAVTMKAQESELPAIQALSYVVAANPDAERFLASNGALPVPDFADGANAWNLDAINVTDFGGGRVVDYDGEGVYIAVLDSGLPYNWREYFPEERIDTLHARGFSGGGGVMGTVSEQPETWEHDTNGHGTHVTSVILGFNYSGPEALPATFNGVAPKATVIPLKLSGGSTSTFWSSVGTRALLYVTELKTSGALGNRPVVVNMSFGFSDPDYIEQAAIDDAIANGVVIVAAAGNEGEAGMRYPAAYGPVISAAEAGWVEEFPADDPTLIQWILRDLAEDEVSEYFIAPDSSRELPGQDLDVAAPGFAVPVAVTQNGQVDYTFSIGTTPAAAHVTGVAALMLEKSPTLTQAQIEAILESTALPVPPGCGDVTFPALGPGNFPTWGDLDNFFLFDAIACWDANATGHGLLQADAALAVP